MDNPTQHLVRLLAPTKAAIAKQVKSTPGTLRNLAGGAPAGVEMRRKLVSYADEHLRELSAAVEAVRATLPDAPPAE